MKVDNNKLFIDREKCCGCTACYSICPRNAIKMIPDNEGFLYPNIDNDKCINCGLCQKVCMYKNKMKENNKTPTIFAAKNKNLCEKKLSSSGGLFAVLSDYVLDNNGVIYGVAFSETLRAVHIRATNYAERNKCMGSKYSQSELKKTFLNVKQDVEQNKMVLFTGTPCQIKGLKMFLQNKEYSNLYLVDIICHSTPSPKLFNEYISYIESKRNKKVLNYFHRSKKLGWSNHCEVAQYEDGTIEFKSSLLQIWKKIFFSNLASRPSCYSCMFTNINRNSDITIADFWGIDQVDSSFYDKDGVSLLIISTPNGEELFNHIKDKTEFKRYSVEDAKKCNPQLYKNIEYDKNERNMFWSYYSRFGFKGISKKYGGYTFKGKVKNTIKILLGRYKRR